RPLLHFDNPGSSWGRPWVSSTPNGTCGVNSSLPPPSATAHIDHTRKYAPGLALGTLRQVVIWLVAGGRCTRTIIWPVLISSRALLRSIGSRFPDACSVVARTLTSLNSVCWSASQICICTSAPLGGRAFGGSVLPNV